MEVADYRVTRGTRCPRIRPFGPSWLLEDPMPPQNCKILSGEDGPESPPVAENQGRYSDTLQDCPMMRRTIAVGLPAIPISLSTGLNRVTSPHKTSWRPLTTPH